MESVLAENEELRQAQLERLRQHADSHLGPMGPLNAELLAEMNERVEVMCHSIFCCLGTVLHPSYHCNKKMRTFTLNVMFHNISFYDLS